MGITGSRDEDGAGMAYVRCNDGSIWLDTGNTTVPWRRLPAIPEPTAEEVDALERAEQEEKEKAERARRAAFEKRIESELAEIEALRARREAAANRPLFSERMGLQRDALQWAARKKLERLAPIRPHWWLW